ncbi:high-affinity choline transporter BetT [Arthrobacter sp. MYb227]|uniref:choline BCCT transporter BetT n=1 Tax=Arthrobacter sp. MYb227 TaxID=1848601 RepID=UPI000CFCCC1E|nr:choline BCCT transporter BetT [Arthrobacter sp. MYb227]PQZ89527.1 high-affinity choline transporter BetT [Arthrobacter sp. MYb227]
MKHIASDKQENTVTATLVSTTNSIQPARTNWRVFLASALVILGITIYAAAFPTQAEGVIGNVVNWASQKLGWVYIVTLTIVLGFVIFLAASRFGSIRLGPDHARPKYRLGTWTAMLFAAGIGVDLMFYSVAGPVAQYLLPPNSTGETVEAARQSVVWTTFHYGISGWSLYALVGAALGYYAFRFKMPLSIRAALYPILGRRVHGRTGDAIDVAATVATVFGLTASLGIGVLQLNFGLTYLFGWPEHVSIQIGLVLLSVLMATISCVSGVDRGIRRLSELNFLLAVGLMLYILIAGKTTMLIDAVVMNLGDFISRFPGMALDTFAIDRPDDWMNAWTLFFWAWWIAWSPFVGMFLARISRGRTLREFVVGVLVVPFLFTLVWISIFGNSAVDAVRSGQKEFGEIAVNTPEHGFYMLLDQYPGAALVAGIATFTGLLFYVTSADSGALMMSSFTAYTTHPGQDGPKWSRIFWALAVGALTIAMLFVGGFVTIQYMTIIMALPFTVILYLIMIAFWRSLKQEEHTLHDPGIAAHGRHRQWRERLARTVSDSCAEDANNYIEQVAEPVMVEVANELAKFGTEISLTTEMIPEVGVRQLDLTVAMERQIPFRYQTYPVFDIPTGRRKSKPTGSEMIRLEIFSATGGRGYDVMGMPKQQLINDIVERFERHVAAGRSHSVAKGMLHSLQEPSNWSEDFANDRPED